MNRKFNSPDLSPKNTNTASFDIQTAIRKLKRKQIAQGIILLLAGIFIVGSMTSAKVKTLNKVKKGSIKSAYLAKNAVNSSKIKNGEVKNADLANDSVTSGKIADGEVSSSDLADSSITTDKIADGNVNTNDLANDSVTAAKIADGQIFNSDLAAGAVNSSKITDGSITAEDIKDGTITAAKMAAGVITGSGSSAWGSITGTLSSQTDLQSALNDKADKHEITVGDDGYGSTFAEAITAIGSTQATLIVPSGTHEGGGVTVPTNVTLKILRGALLHEADGTTLTINGSLEAGLCQVFSWSGSGAVAFGSQAVKEVYPQWWGAKGDDATDCTNAIQAALNSGAQLVKLVGGIFRADSSLLWDATKCAIQMEGAKIDATHNPGTSVIAYNSSADVQAPFVFNKLINSGWELVGDKDTNPSSIGLALGSYNTIEVPHLNFRNCSFHGFSKNVSINQWYAHNTVFENCSMFSGDYGIYCENGGETTEISNSVIHSNHYGLWASSGAWQLDNCHIDYNYSQQIHATGDARVFMRGGHIEASNDNDYFFYNEGTSSLLSLRDITIYNAASSPKTKAIGYTKDSGPGGVVLDNCYFNVPSANYPLTYLIETAETDGGAGVTVHNLMSYDATQKYLVADKLNVLVDGGFEGDDLRDWSTPIGDVPVLSSTSPHDGSKDLKFQPVAGHQSQLSKSVPCRPGDKPRMAFWVKNDFGSSSDSFYAYAGYVDAAGNDISYAANMLTYTDAGTKYSNWTRQFIQPFAPAPPGAAALKFGFGLVGNSDGNSINYIDDAAIEVW